MEFSPAVSLFLPVPFYDSKSGMRDLKFDKNGSPEPSIKEIEDAVRKSRFEEGDTEKFLRSRSNRKANELAIKRYRDQARRLAFVAGFKEAQSRREFWLLPFGIAILLVVFLVQNL